MTARTPKFAEGDRVVLPAGVPDLGTPEERGTVLEVQAGYPGMYVVEVDVQDGRHDDRMREVHEDHLVGEKEWNLRPRSRVLPFEKRRTR